MNLRQNIYWQSFAIFFKLGAFTLGGGYAMVPLIENEIVNKRHWLAKEDFIEMYTKEGSGTLTVQIKSKIEIKVGDKITVTLNGESGAVSVKGDSIQLEGANGVTTKSDSSVKMEAPQVAANASSALKMESSGTATVSGSTVSVG